MTDEERWAAFLAYGQAVKLAAGAAPFTGGIKGRFIAVLAKEFVAFWKKHQDTLTPYLSALTIAALEAVAAQLAEILLLNIRGPR